MRRSCEFQLEGRPRRVSEWYTNSAQSDNGEMNLSPTFSFQATKKHVVEAQNRPIIDDPLARRLRPRTAPDARLGTPLFCDLCSLA